MTRKNYISKVTALIMKAVKLNGKARRQGILSLEDELEDLDDETFRDGLRFVVDGVAPGLIDEILSNKIAFEKNKYVRLYKTVLKRAVLGIQEGLESRILTSVLNSLASLTHNEEKEIVRKINTEQAKGIDKVFDKEMPAMLKALDEQLEIKPKENDKNKQLAFDDIIRFDDRCVQQILRNADTHDLAVAIKTASLAVQGKIFKNMSRNAAVSLKEDMDYMGTLSEEDTREAQQRIIDTILSLEEQGEIIITPHKVTPNAGTQACLTPRNGNGVRH